MQHDRHCASCAVCKHHAAKRPLNIPNHSRANRHNPRATVAAAAGEAAAGEEQVRRALAENNAARPNAASIPAVPAEVLTDITLAVNRLARYCANPTQAHYTAAKRILRYLKGTDDYHINYTGIAERATQHPLGTATPMGTGRRC